MPITHSTVVVVPDDGTSPVGTDEWNASHTVTTITATGGTVTTSTPVLDGTQTWNAGAVTFTGYKLNITNTASAAGSKVLDLQVGGTSVFNMDAVSAASINAISGVPSLTFGSGGFSGSPTVYGSSNNSIVVHLQNSDYCLFYSGTPMGFWFSPDWSIGWSNVAGSPFSTKDLILNREGAGILSQRNSTSAQAQRVYNTYTDASNYERGVFDWTTTANTLTIATQAAGTGSLRGIVLSPANGNTNCAGQPGNEALNVGPVGGQKFSIYCGAPTQLTGNNASVIGFVSGSTATGAADSGVSRAAAKVLQFGDGATNANGWMQWAGQARITADVSFTSNVTLGALATLSVALQAGRTYMFEAELPFTCAAAGGARAAMVATNSLTATNIIYDGWILDSGANGIKGNTQATALGTAVGAVAIAGTAGHISIKGVITVNVAGTLNVQGAQGVSSGTATVFKRGGYLIVHDMP